MNISAEGVFNFLTNSEAEGTRLISVDLDDFPKHQHPQLLVAIDEAQDGYAALFQDDAESSMGSVIVEDDAFLAGDYTLTQDTYVVCVFYEASPNTWDFFLRQGKAQRKVWSQEQDHYLQTDPKKIREPYYGFQLKFESSTSEDDVAEYIVETLTRYRGLVSSIEKLSREERLKRLSALKA